MTSTITQPVKTVMFVSVSESPNQWLDTFTQVLYLSTNFRYLYFT